MSSVGRESSVSSKDLLAGTALAALLILNLINWLDEPTLLSDAVADWAQVRTVQDGEDPYTDVADLAALHGARLADAGKSELGPGEWIHPRTPGALILLYPIGLLEASTVHDLYLFLGTGALWILAVHLVPRLSSLKRDSLMLGTALLLASAPILSSFEFGTVSILVAVLIVIAWIWADSHLAWIPGLALGLAMTLKAWPAVLLVPLLIHRKYRAVAWSVCVAVVLQIAGMTMFGISVADALTALSDTSGRWIGYSGNGSLVAALAQSGLDPLFATISSIVIGLCVVVFVSLRYRSNAYPFAVLVGLTVSPLSWEHYDVVLLAIAVVVGTVPRWPQILSGAFLLLSALGMPLRRLASEDFTPVGLRTLAGRLLMLGAFAVAFRFYGSAEEHHGPTQNVKTPEVVRN